MSGILFDRLNFLNLTLSPTIVAMNTSAEQTFSVKGLKTTDTVVNISKPTTQAGLGIAGARISAKETLAITFMNATGSGITPTANEVYIVIVARPDKYLTIAAQFN